MFSYIIGGTINELCDEIILTAAFKSMIYESINNSREKFLRVKLKSSIISRRSKTLDDRLTRLAADLYRAINYLIYKTEVINKKRLHLLLCH